MKLNYYRKEPVLPGVTRIRCAAGELCYLIEGEERAVLIDTGSGYKGLKETIGEITDLPVAVILTHAHRDHAGGTVMFEKVYADTDDAELIERLKDEEFRSGFPASLKPRVFQRLGREEFPRLYEPEFIPLKDGELIDIGGNELEIWKTPGHTHGSVCIYDRSRRALFAGDTLLDCVLLVFEQSDSVETYFSTLKMLKSRAERCEYMFCSHFDGVVPGEGIDNLIACCEDILAERDEHEPNEMFRRACYAARKTGMLPTHRADGKWGNVFYK